MAEVCSTSSCSLPQLDLWNLTVTSSSLVLEALIERTTKFKDMIYPTQQTCELTLAFFDRVQEQALIYLIMIWNSSLQPFLDEMIENNAIQRRIIIGFSMLTLVFFFTIFVNLKLTFMEAKKQTDEELEQSLGEISVLSVAIVGLKREKDEYFL